MINEILEIALSLAQAAESEIMPRFQSCTVSWKSDGTEVTDADKRGEEVMRELIAKRLPRHAVLGEEFGGPQAPTNEPLWVLDPIDGTTSFALGLPTFGTLIGYIENGEPQVGVIHFPALGETVYAAKGSGCWAKIRGHDARQVQVSGTTNLRGAYVSASLNSNDMPFTRLEPVVRRARKFRVIHDCVQHAFVAQGRIDAAMDTVMYPWDIAALVPCIEEAGGMTSDLAGGREDIVWKRSFLSTSAASLHKEILSLVSGWQS